MYLPHTTCRGRHVTLAALATFSLVLAGCDRPAESDSVTGDQASASPGDPYVWLEEVGGERALDWARQQNKVSQARLAGDPRHAEIRDAALAVYTASDRIPYGRIVGEEVENFWQDKEHVRGIWRRASLESYGTDAPEWRILLDLDALAEAEGENWVWKGAGCLPPDETRCLLRLSRGGADAVVLREYDLEAGAFVEGGFELAEEKQNAEWIDADTLLVASPLEGGSKNTSGYARTIRIWQRGTSLAQAREVFESAETDAFAFPLVIHRPEGTEMFVTRAPDFFHQEVHHLAADGTLTRLALPDDVDFQGLIDGRVIALLRSDWQVMTAGSLVSAPLAALKSGTAEEVELIVAPTDTRAVQGVSISASAVYVDLLDTVTGSLLRATRGSGGWSARAMALPENGALGFVSTDEFSDRLFVRFERFLEPDTLFLVKDGSEIAALRTMPARFDPEPYAVEQRFATSKDGTRVPYFLVHANDLPADGTTPTILYGYGGFEISMTPGYLGPLAVEWLKRGGAWAVANIRGGGEFGPRWHKAALKQNRLRAYEDFAAVAQALIASKVTSTPNLGIYGGSNGGLLVGASMVLYPELYGAVVSAVPLLDMMRYHKLLAGASWIGEYGNPDLAEERDWIARYSPYQKVSAGVTYPPIFLTTSTRDDRVHPGHARKMAAKMTAQGHRVLYYENIEGGHAGAANLEQRAERDALILSFFLQQLGDGVEG